MSRATSRQEVRSLLVIAKQLRRYRKATAETEAEPIIDEQDQELADALLRTALARVGLEDAYDDGSITEDDRFRVLHEIRLIGRDYLNELAEQTILELPDATEKALSDKAKAIVKKFGEKMRRFLKSAFVAGALALGAPSPLQELEARAIEDQLQVQEAFLSDFEIEVLAERAILAPGRAGSYASSVWGAAQYVRAVRAAAADLPYERAVHRGPDRPCDDCVERIDEGWQPIGTLSPIGASQCRQNCHCRLLYGNDLDADDWGDINPWDMPVPKAA